jgi:membrane peptidoglycan carboxypeptidase
VLGSVRAARLIRRALLVPAVVVLLAAAALAALLIATPSVGGAIRLAKTEAARHHAPFPGPPVPHRFAAALTATEDHRFGSEPGIDVYGAARALGAWLTGREEGGATLYQQLAKLLYTPERTSPGAKLEQVGLAIKLRFSYTSAQILQMYSGVAYFGHGFYGLQRASCGYFGRPPAMLSWPQAALLAGLVLAPSADDPRANPAGARGREVHVIRRLVATGMLTRRQAAAALALPVGRLLARPGQHCR